MEEHLKFIKPEFGYEDCRDSGLRHLNSCYIKSHENAAIVATNHYFATTANEQMLAFGMEKAIKIIAGMLFQIEKNNVEKNNIDENLAYEYSLDDADLKTGAYDYLFEPEDLKLLKADKKIIDKYLDEHPEILE